jgi:L-lactate dehydrogenase complex protein LldE
MRIHLFVPCLVEDFFPEIGEAAALVLARAGCEVVYPAGQTCCGQPLYKIGQREGAKTVARRWLDLFEAASYVVAPSGSCVSMVRRYASLFEHEPELRRRARAMASRTYEFCEFLVQKLGRVDFGARFEGRVAYHDSCQVGRALGLVEQPRALLGAVNGLTLLELERPEACCGFGGAFSVDFPEISAAILEDKIADIEAVDPDCVTSAEVSCLMHIRGGLEKKDSRIRVLHIAQILAARPDKEADNAV